MHNIKDKLLFFWLSLDDSTAGKSRLTLVAIIVAGFLLRFYSLSVGQAYTYFAINDEVTALQYALGLLHGDPQMYYLGSPALNQGHVPGPLWTLLVAILYIIGGSSAEGAVFGMVVLNSAAIYLVYRLACRLMPNRYALLSGLLYAFAPWTIYYAAGLYNPIPLALLGAILFPVLWHAAQEDNSRNIFWVCVLGAAIPQFHMMGIFYLPAILLLLYLSPARINLRWFGIGIVAGVVLYLPYIIGDSLNGWQNTKAMLHGDKYFSLGILKILTIPLAVLADHPGQWAGPSFDDFKVFADQYFGSYLVLIVINLLSMALAGIFVFSPLRKAWSCLRTQTFRLKMCYAHHPEIMFLVILLFIPLILYTLTGRSYATRYSILIFPLLYLLPGLFLFQHPGGRLKTFIGYSLAFLFCINLYMVLVFYKDQQERLQNSAMLMPSFARLEKIRHSLYAVLQDNEQMVFSYSETIQKLPEGQRKLYLSISDYMQAYARPVTKTGAPFSKREFLIVSATEDISPYAAAKIVYTSTAIRILQLDR